MDAHRLVSTALAELLGALGHPDRIRLVEELSAGERDVSALQLAVGASRTSISQHLGVMRARHLVCAERRGQHVYYRLATPELAQWLRDGARLLAIEASATRQLATALRRVQRTP